MDEIIHTILKQQAKINDAILKQQTEINDLKNSLLLINKQLGYKVSLLEKDMKKMDKAIESEKNDLQLTKNIWRTSMDEQMRDWHKKLFGK